MKQEKINPASLVPLDIFAPEAPLRVELAYARDDAVCGAVYRPDARLWLHEDLAAVVILAARLANARHGLGMVAYDGLRTVDAQQLMIDSPAARAHPQWFEEATRVLTPPGIGGHPRAMAIDVSLEKPDGILLDMGTAFDELPDGGNGPEVNRAHRLYANLSGQATQNRRMLEDAMTDAAAHLGLPLLPLPIEWWDFRFPADIINKFAPLHDAGLPRQMRMTALRPDSAGPPDFSDSHFAAKKAALLARIAPFL
jgi:D-alanyl-D-alanine dipeptidase